MSCLSQHVVCYIPTRGQKVVIRLAEVSSDMAAVLQHSKMVPVLLEPVFFHSESCHQWFELISCNGLDAKAKFRIKCNLVPSVSHLPAPRSEKMRDAGNEVGSSVG
ncbi:hypothetical protein ACROYT_G010310 [Oculina patagonica]